MSYGSTTVWCHGGDIYSWWNIDFYIAVHIRQEADHEICTAIEERAACANWTRWEKSKDLKSAIIFITDFKKFC